MGIRSRNVASSRAAPAVLVLLVLFQPHRHSSSSSSSSPASSFSLFVSLLLRSAAFPLSLSLSLSRAPASFASLRLSSLTTPLPARSRPWSLPAARTLYSLSPRPRGNALLKNVDLISTTRFVFCGRAADPYLILASCASPSLSSTSISSSSYAARNKPTSTRTLSLAAVVEASR